MDFDLNSQLAFFDCHAEEAYARCLWDLQLRRAEIIAEARRRLTAGYELYGSDGWHWPYVRLDLAALEEAADMVNYMIFKLKQEQG
jgi:hypothetical protein